MSDECPVVQAERHYVEGAERIANLERLIAALYRDGHGNLVPEALQLLADLKAAHRTALEQLELIRAL
jgi:hypothetical protein